MMQFLIRFRRQALITLGVVFAITVVLSVFARPGWAVAIIDKGGNNNVAVAFNTRDNSSAFRLLFKITRTNNRTVDQKNAAIAYASCTSCQTVAGAMQVVLVTRDDVDTVTPTNVAIAVNKNCLDCQTLAAAYQKVISTGGPVRFTDEGNRRIAELRRRFEELRRAGYSVEELQAQFDEIWAELNDVLATELVSADNSGPGNGAQERVLESTSESTFEPAQTTEPLESTSGTPEATGVTIPESTSSAPATPEATVPASASEETAPMTGTTPTATAPSTAPSQPTVSAGGSTSSAVPQPTTSSTAPATAEPTPTAGATETSAPASATPGGSTTAP
jgi:putative peptide zinc metalloprotease protein